MRGIYAITNKINKRMYIGQSIDVEHRIKSHFMKSNQRSHSQLFKDDIEKYGRDTFEISVLEECEQGNLLEREQYYIDVFDPEYNVIKKGKPRDDNFKKAVSEGTKKWWIALPEESKALTIQQLVGPPKGHEVSEETREKIRKSLLGRKYAKKVVIEETGTIFESAEECAKYLGVSHSAVMYNIRGETKKTKGYSIRYYEGVETMGDECSPVG